ncbi:MAG TPA: tetratricopeptide repeat protein, partial [Pyrinomonadaceae bacterium]|nr:tetratricopeptide repeat protein [Pyrinomonadaceae bacterium]
VEGELEELRARALAAKSDAERARAQRALADRLVELNRTEDAVTVLRMLMREDRFDPMGLYTIGNALARLDDAQAAAEAYRKAVAQKRGNYSRALNNLGVVLIRLGHWDEAAAALASALRLENGNYAEASFNTGRLHALRGDPEAAANEYLRALASDPEHVESAVALARAYAEGGEPERALKFLDQFAARFVHRGSTTPRATSPPKRAAVACRATKEPPARRASARAGRRPRTRARRARTTRTSPRGRAPSRCCPARRA